MMFTALTRVRETLHSVLQKLPMDSVEATALIEAIDELDNQMVLDVRAGTYAAWIREDNPVATFCQESR